MASSSWERANWLTFIAIIYTVGKFFNFLLCQQDFTLKKVSPLLYSIKSAQSEKFLDGPKRIYLQLPPPSKFIEVSSQREISVEEDQGNPWIANIAWQIDNARVIANC